MLKLHKKVEYSLIALKHMQEKPANVLSTAKEISETFGLPFDATSRVLQVLSSASWLSSEQGAHGGYRLGKRNLKDLSLYELIELIEGKQGVVRCISNPVTCPLIKVCNMVSPMQKLNDSLMLFLQKQKVTDLLTSKQPQQGMSL